MVRFTDTQLDDAKRTDIAAFLRARGEKLVCSGGEYRWVLRDSAGEHDSVTVRDSRWFDHKRQIGGDAIGFLQEFHGMEFREAVATLLGQCAAMPTLCFEGTRGMQPERKPFALPPKAANMHRLYAYLCKTRHIGHAVVTHFVRAGTLYEEAEYHNAIFIATDDQGVPRGGMKKGTLSDSGFRQTIAGSDTRYAFRHKGNSGQLYVFEAAVDLLSFISLYPQNWQKHSCLALDGVSSKSLRHFLTLHDDVREVCLCLDNDMAGRKAAERITGELRGQYNAAVSTLLPKMKDWNDDLKGTALTHSRDTPEPELTMTL